MADVFSVDAARCLRCGLCVRDCAFKALGKGEDGLPVMASPDKCMRCQHCLAVCPPGAVSFDGATASDCLPAQAELPSLEAVSNWMRLRRSVRAYRPDSVPRATLDAILGTLGNSSTGCNARSLTFTCFPDAAAMDALRARFLSFLAAPHGRMLPRWLAVPACSLRKGGADFFFRGATGLLIVSSYTSSPGVTTPAEDVTLACSRFEMLATAAGFGTCWCGLLGLCERELPGLVEAIAGIPRGRPFQAVLFGLPAVRYPRGVVRDRAARIVYREAEAGGK
jgi:nitroreductase/NAD-dependent dihydropyrimidine dehydrogenase PreA subunit